MNQSVWLFGYGSLIWRPDIKYLTRERARLKGWERRFWQGSHDHRGVPHSPGRVVTLIASDEGICDGVAYLVERDTMEETFAALDHREKNGYERYSIDLQLAGQSNPTPAVTYIAPAGNHAYLGPAPVAELARQISRSAGPSGTNADYLLDLAQALRELDAHDPHVFELEAELTGTRM
jgi:cation transport regulator ChaC